MESVNSRNWARPLWRQNTVYGTRRAGDSRGSSRFLGLPLRAEIRIPAREGVLPLFVEHAGSYLQEEMCSTLAPSHLLFLHHPLAHDLIDRRLDYRAESKTIPRLVQFHPLSAILGIGLIAVAVVYKKMF